ncbi:hypothetical protein CW713_12110 [Methanophagales archaeon]|nr:MAG: hypothetical protein CW713_12110 [Methanophagales archaeon]
MKEHGFVNHSEEYVKDACEHPSFCSRWFRGMSVVMDGRRITWRERRLVIRPLQHAKRAEAGLQRRIEYIRLITKFPKNSLKISEP